MASGGAILFGGLCQRQSGSAKHDHPFDIVDDVGHADFGHRSGKTDRADE